MVVAELDVMRVAVGEPEADPPLIIDRNGMLARTISLQRVQPVPWWYTQIRELRGDVHGFKLPKDSPSDVRRQSLGLSGAEEFLGLAIGEGLDHSIM